MKKGPSQPATGPTGPSQDRQEGRMDLGLEWNGHTGPEKQDLYQLDSYSTSDFATNFFWYGLFGGIPESQLAVSLYLSLLDAWI